MKKKLERMDFLLYQLYPLFSSFFLQQPLPLCKYFNFAANKLSPIGMNLFLLLSRHLKHSNFVGIQMLCKQRGQNMNLFIGWRVFYGLDGRSAIEFVCRHQLQVCCLVRLEDRLEVRMVKIEQ